MIGVMCFTVITLILAITIVLLNHYLFKRRSKQDIIMEMLPQYNCGACGFGSCTGMSIELLKDRNAIHKCRLVKNKEEILKMLEK